jgi:phosphohistidine swiveling domain-containing protein
MKMVNDNRYHNDWVVGAGLNLDIYEDRKFIRAQDRMALKYQKSLLGFEVQVLCGTGKVKAQVFHPEPNGHCPMGCIAVIPHAGVEYYQAAKFARAVIAERGGKMAHLAIVGLEEGFKVVVQPKARQMYPSGTEVTVDCDKGKVDISNVMGHINPFTKELEP